MKPQGLVRRARLPGVRVRRQQPQRTAPAPRRHGAGIDRGFGRWRGSARAVFHGTLDPRGGFAVAVRALRVRQRGLSVQLDQRFQPVRDQAAVLAARSQSLTLPLFGIRSGPDGGLGLGARRWRAAVLFVGRYLQRRTTARFSKRAMLVAFAFFIAGDAHARALHLRRVFADDSAGRVRPPLPLACGRLSVTLLANLVYSFAYQTVMETHHAGRRRDEPLARWSATCFRRSIVALFFFLGYRLSRRFGRRAAGGWIAAATAVGGLGRRICARALVRSARGHHGDDAPRLVDRGRVHARVVRAVHPVVSVAGREDLRRDLLSRAPAKSICARERWR